MNVRNFIKKALTSTLSITAIGAIALAGKSTDAASTTDSANDDGLNLIADDQGDLGYVQSGDVANDVCDYVPWLPECAAE